MLIPSGFRNNTIVHYAAQGSQMELLSLLMSRKCNVAVVNDLTETPLHLAVKGFTLRESMTSPK